MAKRKQPAPNLHLPPDLAAFLAAGKRLEYDPEECDAGAVTLVPLAELKLQRFPVETSGDPSYKDDPNAPGVNSYLVLAVDLIASSNDNYEPAGLLLWLPIERRYAAWDSSHCTIDVFPADVTWERIAADPVPYIEASLGGELPTERLVPWPAHPYGDKQVYKPQPAEQGAAADSGAMIPPDSARVARRAVILYTLMMRFTAETNPHHPRAKDWVEILPQWLDRLEVGSEIERRDAEILATPLGELDRGQQADARWCGEEAGVLGWALQRVAAPADFDPVDPNKVFDALGFDAARMVQSARELIAAAALRPKDELLAYYAHVRVVKHCLRCLRYRSLSAEDATYFRKIDLQRLAARGLEICEADLSAAQEGVARLSDEQQRILGGNYFIRAFAAAWLVGERERYWGEDEEEGGGEEGMGRGWPS
jgi:hypothetical protein